MGINRKKSLKKFIGFSPKEVKKSKGLKQFLIADVDKEQIKKLSDFSQKMSDFDLPSHAQIAEACDCSLEDVRESFETFEQLSWLKKRG